MNNVFIGLGANLHQPIEQLKSAIRTLRQTKHITVLSVSKLYGSKPMGPQDQPDYINAVMQLESPLQPEALLDTLQEIELNQGRVRKEERWGPRTLDLDILLFNQEIIDTPRLTVPHYGLTQREFVVYPLLEIAPQLTLPHGEVLANIANDLPLNGLEALCESE